MFKVFADAEASQRGLCKGKEPMHGRAALPGSPPPMSRARRGLERCTLIVPSMGLARASSMISLWYTTPTFPSLPRRNWRESG